VILRMTMGNILVTGANGFLGSSIIRQAINEGLSIIATDHYYNSKLPTNIAFVPADILDVSSLKNVCRDVESVCHVAGLAHVFNNLQKRKECFHQINVVGAENVAHAAILAGVKHFVLISSVAVYGGVALGRDETSECHPEGPYALSKWQAERTLINLCQNEKINLTILRLATLYGEGDPGNLRRLIRLIDRGRFIWIGKGENFKSLLHCEDAARACVTALMYPTPGINIYNVAAPPRKMHDIVKKMYDALGKRIPKVHIPANFVLISEKVIRRLSCNHTKLVTLHNTIQKWLADDYYSTDNFCKTFDFQTKVDLDEGIRREVEWYKIESSKN